MSQVNITLNTNTVDVNTTNNQIVINDPTNPTTVNVVQPVTTVVEVITPGPQGPQGLPGTGSIANTGSFVTTSSFNSFTSSYNTGSFTGSFSGSLFGTASWSNNSISSSFAISASWAPTQTINTSSLVTTSSFNAFTSSYNTGSFTGSFNGVFTGSLFGTASRAISASWAPSIAGGANTQIQFNSASRLSGDVSFTFDYVNKSLQQGPNTQAIGYASHAEGGGTVAIGEGAHAEGVNTQVGTQNAYYAQSIVSGTLILSESYGDVSPTFTVDGLLYLYDTGITNVYVTAIFTISQSYYNSTNTIVELYDTSVNDAQAYVGDLSYGIQNWIGDKTISGNQSHAEGTTTRILGASAHAEGIGTQAVGFAAHAEGYETQANGSTSHTEGTSTKAIGGNSHAEGYGTQAIGYSSHAEGDSTQAIGTFSHAEGWGTISSGSYQHVQGQYNLTSSDQSAFIIGNGTDDSNRSNLVFAAGNTVQITGSLLVSGSITGSLFGTSSFAVSASWAPSQTINTSSLATTGSNTFVGNQVITGSVNVSGSITGSLFGTASWATNAMTASYALNGGVTQLLAGPNVTLSPTNGLGQVTISSTSGGGGFNTATGSYGSFYDTTTQTNPVANIPRSMSLNTTDITNGVSVSGSTNPFNTYIKTENAGVYDIQFSAQLDKTDSGADEVVIWLRKNGINLTDTATTVTLSGNNAKNVAAWNWFVNSAANDYYQIIWQSADTSVRLFAEPTDGHPGIPSLIVTVNRVDQFLSNTGSFSGQFSGSFSGSGANLNSIPASAITGLNLSQIATGSVTASVSPTQFTVSSASVAEFTVTGTGVTLGSALTDTHRVTGSLNVTGSISATTYNNLPTASASSSGILSSTDWNTFNNKQNTSTLIFDSVQKAIMRDNYFWFVPALITLGAGGYTFATSERISGNSFAYLNNGALVRGMLSFNTTAIAGTLAHSRRNDSLILTGLEAVFTRKIQFNSNVSGQRFFTGISKGNQFAAPTNVEPNTLTDIVGVCQLSTSTNMHVVYNDASGTATTIDLGSSYPCTDSQYNYYITIEQTTTTYIVTVERVTIATGASISTTNTLSSNIPNYATGIIQLIAWISNNASAAIASYLDGGAIGNVKNQ